MEIIPCIQQEPYLEARAKGVKIQGKSSKQTIPVLDRTPSLSFSLLIPLPNKEVTLFPPETISFARYTLTSAAHRVRYPAFRGSMIKRREQREREREKRCMEGRSGEKGGLPGAAACRDKARRESRFASVKRFDREGSVGK